MHGAEFGSSPRVRGTLDARYLFHAERRFIPARAGNARESAEEIVAFAVHPRAPRVRGTRSRWHEFEVCQRFIPARAGNASPRSPEIGANAVHPRACGERPPLLRQRATNIGSSPRVRGTLTRLVRIGARRRFIPARAGNIGARRRFIPARAGNASRHGQASPVGSSPRVRGTQVALDDILDVRRFIPARAGNALGGITICNS